jgi:hypothetical protein
MIPYLLYRLLLKYFLSLKTSPEPVKILKNLKTKYMPEWLKRITKTDIRNILAIIIVIGSFLLLYLLQVRPIPEQNHDLVLTAGGFIFGGALAGVVGFYFGATKGDKKGSDAE